LSATILPNHAGTYRPFTLFSYLTVAKRAALHYEFLRRIFKKGSNMIKTVSRMMVATAALGLVSAPIMVQANTRAGDSGSVYSIGNSAPGLGRAAGGEEQGEEEGGIGTLLLTGGAVSLIVVGGLLAGGVIGDDDSDCVSPGACN
jgi:hypothetical protein